MNGRFGVQVPPFSITQAANTPSINLFDGSAALHPLVAPAFRLQPFSVAAAASWSRATPPQLLCWLMSGATVIGGGTPSPPSGCGTTGLGAASGETSSEPVGGSPTIQAVRWMTMGANRRGNR